eukprot:11415018-Heterocapsa_arctica.AAC.1
MHIMWFSEQPTWFGLTLRNEEPMILLKTYRQSGSRWVLWVLMIGSCVAYARNAAVKARFPHSP